MSCKGLESQNRTTWALGSRIPTTTFDARFVDSKEVVIGETSYLAVRPAVYLPDWMNPSWNSAGLVLAPEEKSFEK